MIGIYKIINKINNKCYIGKSENIENRFKHHLVDLRKGNHYNNHLQKSYNKYGEDNFIFDILEECNLNELDTKEIYWIKYYRDNNFDLYNICDGGEGGRMPDYIVEANKEKISKANKGKDYTRHLGKENGMYGKHHSEETKLKIISKLDNKGKNNPMYGKRHSIETRKKISQSHKKLDYSIIYNKEIRKKMSISAINRCKDPKIYAQLCANLKKKAKYSKEFTIEIQNKFKQGRSVRSLSKEYELPYESTRQLVVRNIQEYYKNQEVNV